jgi:hypothetical protein
MTTSHKLPVVSPNERKRTPAPYTVKFKKQFSHPVGVEMYFSDKVPNIAR